MKKILHLFRDPSHDALWSRYLRMLTLIVLFAFGSHGVWGKTQSVSLENMTPSEKGGKCTWTSNSRTLEWSAKTDNLVKIPGLEGDFSSYYNGNILFSYSGLSDNAKFRVIITKKVGNDETTYEYHFSSTTDGKAKDVVIPIKDFTIQWGSTKITANDLTNVSRIAVAGYDTESGSVSFGTTFTITTSSSAMAMSMKGFQHTSGNKEAQWDATNLKFSWTASSNNFLDLWKYSSDVKDLSAYYGGSFIYKASKISDNDGTKHRLIIRCYAEDGSNKKDFLYASDNATVDYTTIPLSEFKNNGTSISATDLQNVKKIMILGNSSAGALTLGETFTLVAKEDKYKSGIIDAKVGDRNYQIYVPAGITETSGLKLLFTLHGRGNSYKFTENGVPNFQTQADNDKNVVIVSPQGLGNPTVWNAYTDKSNQQQIDSYNTDFEFLKSIILALTKTGTDNPTYNGTGQVTIDRTKVFTVGFSNGGMMSYALVTNHPDVFAAGGSVSGLPVNQYALHKSNGHPVPFIHFQGKGDTYVRYEQSAQHIKNWVAYNGCGSANTITGTYDVNDNTKDYYVEYKSGKVPFHFYGVKNAGHIPNMTYGDTSSSQLIWDFIKDRTLGGNAVDMTVVWCPELSELNKYSSRAWGGIEDNYVATKNENADGNQGVNDRICFEKGKHQLRFTANGTVKIKIYKKGAASAILYKQNTVTGSETGFEFDITEAGDYIVEINRSTGAEFSNFGIYKLDLPIESTILENSKVPTISNGVATYSGVSGGQSTVKYMNVDMTNYKSVEVNCSSATNNFYLHYPTSKSSQLSSNSNKIDSSTSGEMTIACHAGSGNSIDINYFRLGYKNLISEGKDAEDAKDNAVAMYDLTKIEGEAKNRDCIGVSYDSVNKVATFTKKKQYDNLVDLDKGRNGAVGSGIRFHYIGSSFRVIVTADGKDYTCTIPENNSIYWATRHLSWKDNFKLTDVQISKITRIRIGGTSEDSNPDEFKIQHIWFDDVDDYNRTFVCYGWENGLAIDNDSKYQYTLGTAKATFSNFDWGNFQGGTMYLKIPASGTVTISNDEPYTKYTDIKLFFDKSCEYNLSCGTDNKKANGGVVQFNTNSKDITITNNGTNDVYLSKIEFNTSYEVLDDYTLDGRRYWLYVPSSAAKKTGVPVIFSLHGEQEKGANPTDGSDAPNFQSIANNNGVIVVLPEGRKIYDDNTCYGWQADGKENDDTKFIQALVKEIQSKYASQSSSNGYISVDPKRFYLCGFSEGGSMTYACAKVLNGTFAAYGSCGGFPLNEFHLNLATKQPVPFIHLHGDKDDKFGINHLHTIIENLLFRNGCSLVYSSNVTDQYKKYDFTGVNDVPVTTVTFKGHGHAVHASAPQYLWDFFSDKTVGKYDDTDIEWKWDMPTINANIPNSSSDSYYGWKHVINGSDRSLTYGGKDNNEGNHNVYNSIQLTAGKHTLYAQMKSTSGKSTVTLRNILTGAETVARKVVDNSGTTQATTYNVLYEFEVGEGAEFSLELKRSDTNSACTLLEIHKGSYRPEGVKDQSEDNASINLENGKLAELTFEKDENYGVDITPITEKSTENGVDKYNVNNSSDNGNMKLYLISRLGIHDGAIDNKDKYIVKDTVFGHYFQNIPDADIYDRYGASDYMRVVLGTKNSLSGHDDIAGIQTTGKVTIGFWVNGDLAVNRGLAYDEPSMFYIAGNTYNGPNKEDNPHMFNITCSGGLTGYMNDGNFKYNSGTSSFGELCDTKSNADFYNKNFYKDCNWHYITYQMYDNLSRYNMYVDGEPTCLGGYATHNAGSLDSYIAGLNSIVLGGANANNVTFAYDVAFAYDDIVIYNRVLSKREINKIIENKKYSPSVWNFDQNLESNIFFNKDNLNNTMWTSSSDGVYTLNTNFTQAAALTYDGITEIPAFKGLRFVTNDASKIAIDAKSGALRLSQGVKMIFSNMVKDNYVRMEYKHQESDIWVNYNNQNMNQIVGIPSVNEEYDRAGFKITDAGDGKENSITMPSDIEISAIEATDKYFAQIKFVDRQNPSQVKSVVENPKDTLDLPRMDLYINNVERLHKADPETGHKFSYTSSSPHVASVDSITGKVTLHGVSGSTVITAELDNSKRKYDCDIYDEYTFEPSNRIFASYEIVVSPKEKASKVIDDRSYSGGETRYNEDKTIGVTLGGWTYTNGSYYDKYHDEYSNKETWEGHKFEKNADRNGYLANSRKTEEDVFHEFFDDKATFSTNGSHAAKSEQLKVDANNTYAATGNYSAPTGNKSVANATPWLLPCRGSHIKIEPTDAGLISVYVMQEGCVSHAPSGGEEVGGVHYNEDEPIDVTVKRVYVADEKGEIVKEVVADTKSKVGAQMWKDDGRARAEYFWGKSELAYNEATKTSFLNINNWDDQWSFLDNWPNPGMQQHVFKLGKDEDGHVLITKGIVRYTFNVLPGKTYYIFSNTAKLGLAGFTFEKGKHAKYHKVKPDAKHDEWRATGEFDDVSSIAKVELKDGENYSAPTDAKNAEVTLNRTFYKNRWNAICLPYSINRRQIEEVFGDGTMIVLMDNINTSTKKVMFIEHANQDIIAGYPYLIFPTTKADTEKKDTTAINGITTRATFGEANSPLFSVGTDGETYLAELMQSDALVFKGTFTNTTLNEGSYVVTNKGVLSRIPKDEMKIKPYRSYIYFNRQTAGAKAILLQDMNVNGFENDEDNTTGIENLLFESGILTHSADVYSIDGQLVRSKVNNLNGLPKGVYIVNGKKYVKK